MEKASFDDEAFSIIDYTTYIYVKVWTSGINLARRSSPFTPQKPRSIPSIDVSSPARFLDNLGNLPAPANHAFMKFNCYGLTVHAVEQ